MNKRIAFAAVLGALALFSASRTMAEGVNWPEESAATAHREDLGWQVVWPSKKIGQWATRYSLSANAGSRWAQPSDFNLAAERMGVQGHKAIGPGILAMRGVGGFVGPSELYMIGRWASPSEASIAAAGSWAASEQLEFHGALGRTHRYGEQQGESMLQAGLATAMYSLGGTETATQLVGGVTWTTRRNLNVTAEAWYDGSAPSNGFWESWLGRSEGLRGSLALPGSTQMSYGIGRSTIGKFMGSGTSSLRRTNLFLKTSWRMDGWEPGLDLLYTPLDGGLMTTAKVVWQGGRVKLDAGARFFGGRQNSLYSLVPVERVVYVGAAVQF